MVSEEIFEIMDGRRTDGRTPDHGHPISSPCEPNGSGELKKPYVSSFKYQNKYFICPTSVAMATHRITIDRTHFALFGLFLTISEHIFKFISAGPHDEQNDTLHTISQDDTS